MNNENFEKLAGLMSKLSYQLHDLEGIPQEAGETMLEIWREFSWYETQLED